MRKYLIEHFERDGNPDFSKDEYLSRAENINNLRKNLIQKYTHKYPFMDAIQVYKGLIRITDVSTGYVGTLLFDERNGRAYWMQRGQYDFFYPISAKTGRISGEGRDYFRSTKKKR